MDNVLVPFTVAFGVPIVCAMVGGYFMRSKIQSNKWLYTAVVGTSAVIGFIFVVPFVLNKVGYPIS